jgi:hypothetical protein
MFAGLNVTFILMFDEKHWNSSFQLSTKQILLALLSNILSPYRTTLLWTPSSCQAHPHLSHNLGSRDQNISCLEFQCCLPSLSLFVMSQARSLFRHLEQVATLPLFPIKCCLDLMISLPAFVIFPQNCKQWIPSNDWQYIHPR